MTLGHRIVQTCPWLWALLPAVPALASCPVEIFHSQAPAAEEQRIDARLSRAQEADPPAGPVLERPKQLTFNYWSPHVPGEGDPQEAGDPMRPILMPDGLWRVDATGRSGFRFPTLETFLRGGNHDSRRFPIVRRWADGTRTDDPAHPWIDGWDGAIAKWPVRDSRGRVTAYQLVAYLGMMEQPYRLIGAQGDELHERFPSMDLHNFSRSRWAFHVAVVNGVETWTAIGPVMGNKPLAPSRDPRVPMHERGQWVSPGHHHGYGGRPLMDNDGVVMEHDGTPWMILEMVTEQKTVDHGGGATGYLPWITEIVAVRMKSPFEAYAPGERLPDGRTAEGYVKLCSVRDKDGSFNPASDRHGLGYLIEGFNLMGRPVRIGRKSYWVGFASPNNYTGAYGVTMWIREESLGPIGEYTPLVDDAGVWRDITAEFRRQYGMPGWFGRGDGFFTPEQLKRMAAGTGAGGEVPFQMIAHGVNRQSLPPGFALSGWPAHGTYAFYLRAQWLLFGRFFENAKGLPDVRWSLPEPDSRGK